MCTQYVIHCTLTPSQVPGVLCGRHDCIAAVSWQVHATDHGSLLALPATVDSGIHMVSNACTFKLYGVILTTYLFV